MATYSLGGSFFHDHLLLWSKYLKISQLSESAVEENYDTLGGTGPWKQVPKLLWTKKSRVSQGWGEGAGVASLLYSQGYTTFLINNKRHHESKLQRLLSNKGCNAFVILLCFATLVKMQKHTRLPDSQMTNRMKTVNSLKGQNILFQEQYIPIFCFSVILLKYD